MDKKLLEMLLTTPSVSGYELEIQKKLIKYLEGISEKTIKEENMNVIHVLNEKSKVKLMFLTHIDEIGLVVNKINEDGSLKVEKVGGIRPYMYTGQHVEISHQGKIVPGIISYLPNMDKGIETSDLFVEIGTNNKEESEKLVEIGDPVVVKPYVNYLQNNKIASRALDDKIAVYIMAQVLANVSKKTTNGVYFSSTVGEETTSRGAKKAVKEVMPTCVIALDVCYASDRPYITKKVSDIALGKGLVLTSGSVMNKKLDEILKNHAKNLNLRYQVSVEPSRTFTDGDYTYDFAPTYLISIPLRYMHSAVEVVDMQDVEDIIKLLTEFILKYDENTSLNPFDE